MTGAELTKWLRESGSGEDKLVVCRKVLAEKPAVSGEHMLAALEAAAAPIGSPDRAVKIEALGEALGRKLVEAVGDSTIPPGTIEKARKIMTDGKWDPTPPPIEFPEDKILREGAEGPKKKAADVAEAMAVARRKAEAEAQAEAAKKANHPK